jgi:nitrogenase-stabilizing/protective protein
MNLDEELQELESAEDFFQYFELEYDASVVHVNRLHILQRFHDYLEQAKSGMPEDETQKRVIYSKLLSRAYTDFVNSDAVTEKVFKVFNMNDQQDAFVSLTDIKQ